MNSLELWYRQPASRWTEALPIGNGRLGAMVFGGVAREQLQINEDTLWAGGPYSQVNREARPYLDEVRTLIAKGDYAGAEALADKHLMGRPLKQMPYQPAGDVWLDFPGASDATNYRRSLDLDAAIANTAFDLDGVTYSREVFASPVDGIVVLRLRASVTGRLSFRLSVTSGQPGSVMAIGNTGLQWLGTNRAAEGIAGRLSFAIRATVRSTGGSTRAEGSSIVVSGADEAVILIDVATSFVRFDAVDADPLTRIEERLAAIDGKSFAELRAAHISEHQRLFRRLSLDLGSTDAANLPTDERIARDDPASDPALAALYLNYARYLMISCSRPGTQPVTLQGIWNDLVEPPWGSKYTANINLQMHYWLPAPANLMECVEPLIAMVEDLAITGAEMAREHYGARGWVLHHNTDLWRAAGPVDGAKWGLWPTGGAWLCAQLWDYASYLGDEALVARLYRLLKGAAQFFIDTLVPLGDTGLLVTSPSLSPENVHPYGASLCAGPAMDSQILRDLFDAVVAASEHLAVDGAFRHEIVETRRRLAVDRIGSDGQLQEWLEDWDLDVPEIHHRHVSHLYGLYPSRQIEIDRTPALAAAARRSLEIRGDDATGWGIGWRINLWARLRDGEHAHDLVCRLLGPERTYPNMFDAHPPFQIDGNFGGAAGILEMLVQSDGTTIHLLPALPAAWATGSLHGVRARGGAELDLDWTDGRLSRAVIKGGRPGALRIVHPGGTVTVEATAGTDTPIPL